MKIKQIRSEIDKIDSEIIELLSRRSTLVTRAARLKSTKSEVRDSKRVDRVIHKVREKAFDAGLDPSIAEDIYRHIIACFISKELKKFNSLNIEYQDV